MNRVLEMIYESGLAIELMKKRVSLRFLNEDSKKKDKSRLADASVRFRIEHIFTALVAIAVGTAVATVVFAMEVTGGGSNHVHLNDPNRVEELKGTFEYRVESYD